MPFKEALLNKTQNIHIIGAGGVGMSALALLAQKFGFRITASDQQNSEYLQKLKQAGITTWVGSRPQDIPPQALVFRSSAVGDQDPEVLFARKNQIPVLGRQPLLRWLTQKHFTIAICGSHGKTTSTGWLAFLLYHAGLDPSALVGGTLSSFHSNTLIGQGSFQGKPLLVLEADESDKSFLSIEANMVGVTNIELDHPDRYQSEEELFQTFVSFFQKTKQRSAKVFASMEVYPRLFTWAEPLPNLAIDAKKSILFYNQKKFPIALLGKHNLYNASLVLQIAHALQVPEEAIAQALKKFPGVKRRMEILAQWENTTLMDDYAHHPTEIQKVLETVEPYFENFVVVWEPHRLSRLSYFLDEFILVFQKFAEKNQAKVLKMPVFLAGERPKNFPVFAKIQAKLQKYFPQEYHSPKDLPPFHNKRTLILFLGAGNSSRKAQELKTFFSKQTPPKAMN